LVSLAGTEIQVLLANNLGTLVMALGRLLLYTKKRNELKLDP